MKKATLFLTRQRGAHGYRPGSLSVNGIFYLTREPALTALAPGTYAVELRPVQRRLTPVVLGAPEGANRLLRAEAGSIQLGFNRLPNGTLYNSQPAFEQLMRQLVDCDTITLTIE